MIGAGFCVHRIRIVSLLSASLISSGALICIFHDPDAGSGDPAYRSGFGEHVGRVPSRGAPSAFQSTCEIPALNGVLVGSGGADAQLGREAAIRYCQTCHLLPKPELLDRETWVKGALPHMAPWLGVARLNLESRPDGKRLAAAGVFPSAPVLSEKEWRVLPPFHYSAAPPAPPQPTNQTCHPA